jgi:hypothetical protein
VGCPIVQPVGLALMRPPGLDLGAPVVRENSIRAESLGSWSLTAGPTSLALLARGKASPKGTRWAPSMPESGIVSMTKYDRARMVRPRE